MGTCISTDRITSAVVPNALAIADCLAHTAKVRPQDANAQRVYQWALQLDPCNIVASMSLWQRVDSPIAALRIYWFAGAN